MPGVRSRGVVSVGLFGGEGKAAFYSKGRLLPLRMQLHPPHKAQPVRTAQGAHGSESWVPGCGASPLWGSLFAVCGLAGQVQLSGLLPPGGTVTSATRFKKMQKC